MRGRLEFFGHTQGEQMLVEALNFPPELLLPKQRGADADVGREVDAERNAEKERYPRPADIEALERDFEEARLALSARLLDQG